MSLPLLIRPSTPADLPAVTAIYGWNVMNGTGTFELDAPDLAEMTRRRDDVLSKGLPWLVAQRGDQVLGYAYANHFRPRRAYRFCVEDSIYLSQDAQGQGAGKLLLAELIAQCEARGARQMLAVLGRADAAVELDRRGIRRVARPGAVEAAELGRAHFERAFRERVVIDGEELELDDGCLSAGGDDALFDFDSVDLVDPRGDRIEADVEHAAIECVGGSVNDERFVEREWGEGFGGLECEHGGSPGAGEIRVWGDSIPA